MTHPAEAPKLCVVCGDTATDQFSDYSGDGELGILSCQPRCDRCGHRYLGKCAELVSARRAAAAERPIQAGDWVECLPGKQGLRLKDGERYEVERVIRDRGANICLVGHGTAFDAYRFKRVDGPHPKTASEPKCRNVSGGIVDNPHRFNESGMCVFCHHERTVGTGNAQSSVPGEVKPTCANHLDGAHYFSAGDDICIHCGIWRMHTYEHAHEQALADHCPECATALTPETTGRAPYCSGCTERRWPMVLMRCDPYEEHRLAEQSRSMGRRKSQLAENQLKARARTEAWLAAEARAERPRLTATRRMLDRGHPVCWPSNEGED